MLRDPSHHCSGAACINACRFVSPLFAAVTKDVNDGCAALRAWSGLRRLEVAHPVVRCLRAVGPVRCTACANRLKYSMFRRSMEFRVQFSLTAAAVVCVMHDGLE